MASCVISLLASLAFVPPPERTSEIFVEETNDDGCPRNSYSVIVMTVRSNSPLRGFQSWWDPPVERCVYHGWSIGWHQNGSIAYAGAWELGVRTGTWLWWHDNGNLAGSVEFLAGNRWGLSQYWHYNGSLSESSTWCNSLKNGLCTLLFDNGAVWCQGEYQNDLPEGAWRYWHPDGRIALDCHYDCGERSGIWTIYDEEGRANGRRVYCKKGELLEQRDYFLSGERWMRGQYLNDMATGRWTYWHEDGAVALRASYENNEREGPWTWYDQDGKVSGSERYSKGQAVPRPFVCGGCLVP